MNPTEGMALIVLNDNNLGKHSIYGPATRTYYGYRRHGDQFYVWQTDANLMVAAKTAILAATVSAEVTPAPEEVMSAAADAPDAPDAPDASDVSAEMPADDLLKVWGVDAARVEILHRHDVATYAQLAELEDVDLVLWFNINESTARRIKTEARKLV